MKSTDQAASEFPLAKPLENYKTISTQFLFDLFGADMNGDEEAFARIKTGLLQMIACDIFHQNRADSIRAQLRAHAAIAFPQTFVIAADIGTRLVNPATAAFQAILAEGPRGFLQFFDFEHLTAQAAGAACLSWNIHHINLAIAASMKLLILLIAASPVSWASVRDSRNRQGGSKVAWRA